MNTLPVVHAALVAAGRDPTPKQYTDDDFHAARAALGETDAVLAHLMGEVTVAAVTLRAPNQPGRDG